MSPPPEREPSLQVSLVDTLDRRDALRPFVVRRIGSLLTARYDEPPRAIIGISGVSNRLAADVATGFSGRVMGLTTGGDPDPKTIELRPDARRVIQDSPTPIEHAVVLGYGPEVTDTMAEVARQAHEAGATNVDMITTWPLIADVVLRPYELELVDA